MSDCQYDSNMSISATAHLLAGLPGVVAKPFPAQVYGCVDSHDRRIRCDLHCRRPLYIDLIVGAPGLRGVAGQNDHVVTSCDSATPPRKLLVSKKSD